MAGRVEINRERCKGCSLCVHACPQKILTIGEAVNTKGHYSVIMTEEDKCTGCAFCALICPDVALEVFRTIKNKGE